MSGKEAEGGRKRRGCVLSKEEEQFKQYVESSMKKQAENVAIMDGSREFVERAAAVWKRQFEDSQTSEKDEE